MINKTVQLARAFILALLITACGQDYSPEQKEYISKIELERVEKNNWMQNDPSSPFNYKGKVEFHELNYFDIDPDFVFRSKLYELNPKDTVTIYGTKGEPRKVVRYGYVLLVIIKKITRLMFMKAKVRTEIFIIQYGSPMKQQIMNHMASADI